MGRPRIGSSKVVKLQTGYIQAMEVPASSSTSRQAGTRAPGCLRCLQRLLTRPVCKGSYPCAFPSDTHEAGQPSALGPASWLVDESMQSWCASCRTSLKSIRRCVHGSRSGLQLEQWIAAYVALPSRSESVFEDSNGTVHQGIQAVSIEPCSCKGTSTSDQEEDSGARAFSSS